MGWDMKTLILFEPLKYKYLCPNCKNTTKMSNGYFNYLKDNVVSEKIARAGYTCPKCSCTDMNFINHVYKVESMV